MPHFKINHENELEWNDDDNDPTTFIVITAQLEKEFGYGTFVCTNRKIVSAISKKFKTIGHFSCRNISQFDIKIDTGITHLKEGMKIIGKNALRTFLDVHSHLPLSCLNLEQLLSFLDMHHHDENTFTE